MENKLTAETQLRLQLNTAVIQSIEVLQMDQIEVEEYINKAVLENPVIEIDERSENQELLNEYRKAYLWMQKPSYVISTEDENVPDDRNRSLVDSELDQIIETNISFSEQLKKNVESPKTYNICIQLISLFDNHGYLHEEDIEHVKKENHYSDEDIADAIKHVQALEPAGIGARSITECLCLQLERKSNAELAIFLVKNYLNKIADRNTKELSKLTRISRNDIETAVALIKTLYPYPYSNENSKDQAYLGAPDAYLIYQEKEPEIIINDSFQPTIHIREEYLELLKTTDDKATREYLKDKIRLAYELQEALHKRKNTFYNCLKYIADYQKDFLSGSSGVLNPLSQEDLATALKVHKSTVSRALREKYIQTQHGTYKVSKLLSKRSNSSGGSVSYIYNLIKSIIAQEDPKNPLSDNSIKEKLSEQGITLPRRTIAQYRSELDIPNCSKRKTSSL